MEKEFQETRFSAKILDLNLQSNRCDVKHKQRGDILTKRLH